MVENWGWLARGSTVAVAVVATAPVWPVLQPGEPIPDEMLAPAEVAVIVPIVLVFPVAWALLGRTRRYGRVFGLALAGLVFAWAAWTAYLGEYGTPPNVDDGLHWYLLTAAALVVGAVVVEARKGLARPGLPGVVCWTAGIAVTAMVPVVDAGPLPADDVFLPLPPGLTVVADQAECQPSCTRRLQVTGPGLAGRDVARQLGDHLGQAKGWQVTWYDFTPQPTLECRGSGRVADPYQLCAAIRIVDERPTVEIMLAYADKHDPIY